VGEWVVNAMRKRQFIQSTFVVVLDYVMQAAGKLDCSLVSVRRRSSKKPPHTHTHTPSPARPAAATNHHLGQKGACERNKSIPTQTCKLTCVLGASSAIAARPVITCVLGASSAIAARPVITCVLGASSAIAARPVITCVLGASSAIAARPVITRPLGYLGPWVFFANAKVSVNIA
jgi:hypothetical protein